MGYRFVLRRLEYPQTVAPGSMAMVHMWWLNAGAAPIYRKYTLAMQIINDSGGATIHLPVDIRKWLPGDSVYDGTIYVPASLKPGSYRLRVGMLDPMTGQPAIQLAIEGRAFSNLSLCINMEGRSCNSVLPLPGGSFGSPLPARELNVFGSRLLPRFACQLSSPIYAAANVPWRPLGLACCVRVSTTF